MEARDTIGPLGTTASTMIQLDNQAPTIPIGAFEITSPGGSCGDFTVGATIEGIYSASDNERLYGVSFSVEPSGNPVAHVVTSPPNPLSQSGTWSLNTGTPTPMTTCGYVIRLDATDNTIVNSAVVGHDQPAFIGFCLRNP
jgi:CRISPR/Cas system endoribonuclease Cas6 (RAMP superfamily)